MNYVMILSSMIVILLGLGIIVFFKIKKKINLENLNIEEEQKQIVADARKKAGTPLDIDIKVLERQCDTEYVAALSESVNDYEAVISMACGVGPQFLSEMYKEKKFYPGVNTTFFGGAVQHGIWEERCGGCGTCSIHDFGGLCPIARCAKSLLHGPCGGSTKGICEVNPDTICVWDAIVTKKMAAGEIGDLMGVKGFKDWRSARDGGPRRSIREELIQGNI